MKNCESSVNVIRSNCIFSAQMFGKNCSYSKKPEYIFSFGLNPICSNTTDKKTVNPVKNLFFFTE